MSESDEPNAVELYRKYRPTKFSQLIGQESTVATLNALGKSGKLPHAMLLSGPSGVGKTTAARIIKRLLKCHDRDFFEVNGAEKRGIEDIRSIQSMVPLSPIGGPCRIWLLDEIHKATNDAQNCMLKMLEDTPDHCYFMLASSEPTKLIKAIRTRCTEIKFKSIPLSSLKKLVIDTAKLEGKVIEEPVALKIAEAADGSARGALVVLGQVINLPDRQSQLQAVERVDAAKTGFEIAQALLAKKDWKTVAALLTAAQEQDPEAIRRIVLGYMKSALLGGNARAFKIIECFRVPTYDIGMPGIVADCYDACTL